MRTKKLWIALALPTIFAACTADDYELEQSGTAALADRRTVGEVSFVTPDASSRLVYNNGLKWTAEDKLGAALMDELVSNPNWEAEDPTTNYTIVDKIYSNYQYDYDGSGFSNGNATLVEGNYFVYAQFNKDQKRSGLAYSIQNVQETGTGYDAWYKNQFFLDHIFVKQGDSQVAVNVLPVFPKINMAIAYEGANTGVQVRKVIVKDEKGFALEGSVNPASVSLVNYDALAKVTATGVEGKDFDAADYKVATGSLADVFNAYKKAVADLKAGVFTLKDGETAEDFVSPNIAKFITGTKEAESVTLNYTTPTASAKGVMVLPLSETHDAAKLTFEIYTSKGLVTLGGTAGSMNKAMTFNTSTTAEDGSTYAQAYATAEAKAAIDKTKLLDLANADIRFNTNIDSAFVQGMLADGLKKVEIGFKDDAILVPAELTVTSTTELKYYLTNWYAGKKDKIVGGNVDDKNNVVVINANPLENTTIDFDNEVLNFIKNAANPSLKFNGQLNVVAGTSADALNNIAQASELEIINNATQTWTATQSYDKLTNKGTLTIGTGEQNEKAVYTVAEPIVNEGTMTIKKTLEGGNTVYNVGTINVNAALGTLVNGVAKAAPAKEADIVAAAVANVGKVTTALNNYAIVKASDAEITGLVNNNTVNVAGTTKVIGTSKNNSIIVVEAGKALTVAGKFENAAEAQITNNGQMVISTADGDLTNYGKIINNMNISCNADGAKFVNNKDMEANANSITLISENNAGAEILVADNTAIINIPKADESEGKVTFIVDEQADLAVIPSCANSLRITAASIDLTKDVNSTESSTQLFNSLMTKSAYLEFRSQSPMTIKYPASGVQFENVKYNANGATSQVRFTTSGNVTASSTLEVSKNAMVIVNNELSYSGAAYDLKNEGQLYVIGKLVFGSVAKPSDAGKAFMGDVYCTGGETANIEWADSSSEIVVAGQTEIKNALNGAVETITLASNLTMTEPLSITDGETIKGNGKTLESNVARMVTIASGKIEDLIIDGKNTKSALNETKRGIYNNDKYATGDITIDNVTVKGVGYAMNMYGTAGTKLIVNNSSLTGWTSTTGFDSASFTNCHFGIGSYYEAPVHNGNLKPYHSVVLTNCTFDKGFCLDFEQIGTGTITLINCKVNGVVITSSNIKSLLGSANPTTIPNELERVLFE